jgi:L-aspartate oxidase
MGGIETDLVGRTSVPGLWAVGETASTGVHGANRLASNSLLECLVFAHRIATCTPKNHATPPTEPTPKILLPAVAAEKVHTVLSELPTLCWETCGIVRTAADLKRGLAQLQVWRTWLETADWTTERASLEARNQICVAYLVLQSALWREESRGAHFRADFPLTLGDWQVHSSVQGERWNAEPLGKRETDP